MTSTSGDSNDLRTALEGRQFCHSFELVLGRGHDLSDVENFVREAAADPSGIRVVSATDLPGGRPAAAPEALLSFVVEQGLTAVAPLTGKDGNRNFLEARLHALAHMGVRNVLALTGDAHLEASTELPKPVYDLDSVLILKLIEAVRKGISYRSGTRDVVTAPYDFMAGAVVNPFKVQEPDLMMQLYKLELKVAAGAQFIITQLGFDIRKLYETKQYMEREGLGHIPLIANVYVPTATVAELMSRGAIPGCVVSDDLLGQLRKEKKPQRLERAALFVAACEDLGFAGVHFGGFGITHRNVRHIISRSQEIGSDWRGRMDELLFPYPGQFHLFPEGDDGLSDSSKPSQYGQARPRPTFNQRTSDVVHRVLFKEGSLPSRLLAPSPPSSNGASRDDSWRKGPRYALMGLSELYRRAAWSCLSCGDCIQDHLNFPGCTMSLCYKELRNGPCGGSKVDGTCEVDSGQQCIWNAAYFNTVAAGDDPRKFARTLIPSRDWSLDQTNAMVNRLAGLDNHGRRTIVDGTRG